MPCRALSWGNLGEFRMTSYAVRQRVDGAVCNGLKKKAPVQ